MKGYARAFEVDKWIQTPRGDQFPMRWITFEALMKVKDAGDALNGCKDRLETKLLEAFEVDLIDEEYFIQKYSICKKICSEYEDLFIDMVRMSPLEDKEFYGDD